MIFAHFIATLLIPGMNITVSDAEYLSSTLETNYIAEGFSITTNEMDVPSLGAPIDSIHTISLVETGFGFTEIGAPFAIMLYRNEVVRVTFSTAGGFAEKRHRIDEIQPYRLVCAPSGETALILGHPDTDQVTPAVFIDFNTASRTHLQLPCSQGRIARRQLQGKTLLLNLNERWEGFDVSGTSLFVSDSIRRNTATLLIDNGNGILFSEDHGYRGATITRFTRDHQLVWTLDTGLPSIDLTVPSGSNTGYYHSQRRNESGGFSTVTGLFDLDTGELLDEREFPENGPSIRTSQNGQYRFTQHITNYQGVRSAGYEMHQMNSDDPVLMYADSIISEEPFASIGVLAVSDTGRVLMQASHGYTFTAFCLLDNNGELIWMSEPIRGDEFPSFTGVSTNWSPPPAMLSSSGTTVIYSDHHCIRIVSVSETH